jgi:hypothetical protein
MDKIHSQVLHKFSSIFDLDYIIFLCSSTKESTSNIRISPKSEKIYTKHNYMIESSFYLWDNVSKMELECP